MYQVFHRIEVIFCENVTQANQFFNKGKENKIQNSIKRKTPNKFFSYQIQWSLSILYSQGTKKLVQDRESSSYRKNLKFSLNCIRK